MGRQPSDSHDYDFMEFRMICFNCVFWSGFTHAYTIGCIGWRSFWGCEVVLATPGILGLYLNMDIEDGRLVFPNNPCMVYLPAFGRFKW